MAPPTTPEATSSPPPGERVDEQPQRPRLFSRPSPPADPPEGMATTGVMPDVDDVEDFATRSDEQLERGPATASRPLSLAERGALKDAIKAGVFGTTGLMNDALSVDELERVHELWLADEQDAEGIADPLAAILARRGGLVAGAANPDVGDAIRAAIALAVYVVKQLNLKRHLRRLRRAGQVDETAGLGDPGTPATAGAA